MRGTPSVFALTGMALLATALLLIVDLHDRPFLSRLIGQGTSDQVPQGLKVAVVEVTTYHDEVIGAVLTVLHDLGVDYSFHRERFESGFAHVIQDIHPTAPRALLDLENRLNASEIDAVVLTTCDAKFWHDSPHLYRLIATQARHIICIPHEIEHFDAADNKAHYRLLAEKGGLSILTLATPGAAVVQRALGLWEAEDDLWGSVMVDHFAPVFKLPEGLLGLSGQSARSKPSSAAILGRIQPWSRRYNEIMSALLASMLKNPTMWGYELIQTHSSGFVKTILKPVTEDAFHLHLIGKIDSLNPLEIPPLLKGDQAVVVVHENVDYPDFYRTISTIDVVLPAFKTRKYYDYRASASIPAAIIARKTPLLAVAQLQTAYTYLAPPALRECGENLTEVQALERMRVGELELSSASEGEWESYELGLKSANMAVWARMLRR